MLPANPAHQNMITLTYSNGRSVCADFLDSFEAIRPFRRRAARVSDEGQ